MNKAIIVIILFCWITSPSISSTNAYLIKEGMQKLNIIDNGVRTKQKYLRNHRYNDVVSDQIPRELLGKKEKKHKKDKEGNNDCKKYNKGKKSKKGKSGNCEDNDSLNIDHKKTSKSVKKNENSKKRSTKKSKRMSKSNISKEANESNDSASNDVTESFDYVSSPNPNTYQNHTTVLFPATDVSFVEQQRPTDNFNDQNVIMVDLTGRGKDNNKQISLLKFAITCVAMPITRVKLILYVVNASRLGGLIFPITNNWHDHSVTWINKPMKINRNETFPLNSIGKVVVDDFVEVNLPLNALSGNSDVSFMISPQDNNGAHYASQGDLRPTLEVTYSGNALITGECNKITPRSMPMHSINSFQMKLYWEEGYTWQEETDETAWCVQCTGNCETGIVKIKECDNDNIKQFWHYDGSGKIFSDYNNDYCISYQHPPVLNEPLSMEECFLRQDEKFNGLRFDDERFDWHPHENHMLCVSNQHHPRSNEDLRFTDCDIALRDNTNFWVIGSWDGHP